MLPQAQEIVTSIKSASPWVALTVGIFLFVYATRRFTPKLWVLFDKITPDGMLGHVLQGVPSVLIGALWTVFTTGGSFKEAWLGALMGALAPVLHLLMKKYTGAANVLTAIAAAQKMAQGGVVLLLLGLVGCAGSFEEAKMSGMQERAAKRPGVAAAVTPPSDYCRSLDSGHRLWAGVGKFEMVASGGLASTAVFVDDSKARIGVLVGAALLAAGGAGTIVVSDADAEAWARDCQ